MGAEEQMQVYTLLVILHKFFYLNGILIWSKDST